MSDVMVSDHRNQAFGIYVHWPFCAAKCPYCDFNSHVRHRGVDQSVFVEAYLRQIEHVARQVPDRKVTSIFFGGGTPSLMEGKTVDAILSKIRSEWDLAEDSEITLEANPTSVEADRFRDYRNAGVNRLSLGIQSLRDEQLQKLGRLHSAAEAIGAIETARENFPRISFDMIYARPQQTLSEWEQELSQALELAADHLSLYQLTIEQGTPFFDLHQRGKLVIPDEDLAADLYELTAELTGRQGLSAYEISNYAKPDATCAHNLVYWRYQDYAGIGPGAHGRLTLDGKKHATACHRNPEQWWQAVSVDGLGYVENQALSDLEQADELLVMNLRLAEGMDPKRYEVLSGRPFNQENREFLEEKRLIESTADGKLRATPSGFLLLDAIAADLGMEPGPDRLN